MKEIVVYPERCVGCMQCMMACATAHSKTNCLLTAVLETPVPKPRVHVGAGLYGEGFPNRCRHCDPAPCMLACLPSAIFRDTETNTVIVDYDKCINCASCAMACPFGVICFHEEFSALPGKKVAIKCDNCIDRQKKELLPACVEACRTKALTFDYPSDAMRRKTSKVAKSISLCREQSDLAAGVTLLNTIKKTMANI